MMKDTSKDHVVPFPTKRNETERSMLTCDEQILSFCQNALINSFSENFPRSMETSVRLKYWVIMLRPFLRPRGNPTEGKRRKISHDFPHFLSIPYELKYPSYNWTSHSLHSLHSHGKKACGGSANIPYSSHQTNVSQWLFWKYKLTFLILLSCWVSLKCHRVDNMFKVSYFPSTVQSESALESEPEQ